MLRPGEGTSDRKNKPENNIQGYVFSTKKNLLAVGHNAGKSIEHVAKLLGYSVKTLTSLAQLIWSISTKADEKIAKTSFLAKPVQYELLNALKMYGRSHIIRMLLLLSIIVLAGKGKDTIVETSKDIWFSIQTTLFSGSEVPVSVGLDPIQQVDMQELQGYGQTQLNGFLSVFLTGSTHTDFTDTLAINFRDNLKKAYAIKFANNPEAKENTIQRFYNETVTKYINGEVNFHSYSLQQWEQEFNQTADEINTHFDRSFLENKNTYNLSHERVMLAKEIVTSLRGKDALSFSLTEICGDLPGKFGVKYMETLCKYGGREFVMMLPALADDLVSMGPYQNTMYVVYAGAGAASKMSEGGLPKDLQIPGSMIYTHPVGKDAHVQHKVAYLNMIYNIVYMMKHLTATEFETLEDKWEDHHDEIVQYIATAHNRPASAIKAVRFWLANSCKSAYTVSTDVRIKPYAQRTKKFQDALKEMKREMGLSANLDRVDEKIYYSSL